jgi:hypothetical protein
VKYASKIRDSGQKDLIDRKDWVVNDMSKISNDVRKMGNDVRRKATSSFQKYPSLHNIN